MPYVGNPLANAFSSRVKQDLTGQSGTSFTLTHAVSSANDLSVYINHVRQEPTTAYTVDYNTLTTTGSVAGTDDFYIIYDELGLQSIAHDSAQAMKATSGTFTGAITATQMTSSGAVSGTTGTFSGDLTIDTSTLKVDAANNRVGIGTASPVFNTEISNASTSTTLTGLTDAQLVLVNTGTATANQFTKLGFRFADGSYNAQAMICGVRESATSRATALTFSSAPSSDGDPDERVRIDSSGKVGIGTTTPRNNLDFGVTSNNDHVIALRDNNTSRTILGLTNGYGVRVGAPSDGTNTEHMFEVGQINASDGTTYQNTKFAVAYNGHVGVGSTPDSSYQFLVKETGAGSGIKVQAVGAGCEAYLQLQGETSGGSTRTIMFKQDNGDSARLACSQAVEWTIESSDVAAYRMKSDRQQIMSISGDQNPGNNMATLTLGYHLGGNKGGLYMPTYSYYGDIYFEVRNNDANNGRQHDDILFKRNGSRHGGIRIIGNSGVSYQSISDYREKTDEKPIDDAIGTVKKLKPYNFKWKKSGIRQDGFFAHEVDEILDYAVSGKKDATKTYEGVVLNKEGYMIASDVKEEDFDKRLIDKDDEEASPKGETTYPEGSTWKETYEDIDPQQMDPAKLVPILTAALQEAIKRIEVLESK